MVKYIHQTPSGMKAEIVSHAIFEERNKISYHQVVTIFSDKPGHSVNNDIL